MSTVPAPPFLEPGEADHFRSLLLLRVRELSATEPVSLAELVLGQALEPHEAEDREQPALGRWPDPVRCAACGTPYPCRTVLVVACATRLPVDWTPESLARALAAAGFPEWAERLEITDTSISWGTDPRMIARRAGWGWSVDILERGALRSYRDCADGPELCDLMQEEVAGHAEYPFGWAVRDQDRELVAPRLESVRDWWRKHRALPYIAKHEPGYQREP